MTAKLIYNIVIHIIKCSKYTESINTVEMKFARFSQNFLAHQRPVAAPSTTNPTPTQQSSTATTTTAANPPPPAAAAAAENNNNEFEQENDLLGVLNMLVELFVLCSIIYFYSTFSRFLVVFLIFALLYL